MSQVCPLCGVKADAGEAFCKLCGAALQAAQERPPARPTRRGFLELPGGERVEVTHAPCAVGREQLGPYAQGEEAGRISRAHFTVAEQGGRFMIEDGPSAVQRRASVNGTWVAAKAGDARVRLEPGGPLELEGGESIDVGGVVTVRFVVEEG